MLGKDIKELKIHPVEKQGHNAAGTTRLLATCTAKLDCGIIITGIRIMENDGGVYVEKKKDILFETKEKRREFSNRILATYVINHCIDDYSK